MKMFRQFLVIGLVVGLLLWSVLYKGSSPKNTPQSRVSTEITQAPASVPTYPAKLTLTQIRLETMYELEVGLEEAGYFDITGSTEVEVVGDYIKVQFNFNRPMDMASVEKGITLLNAENLHFHHNSDLSAYLSFPEVAVGDYTLWISKDITDVSGQTLGKDIEIQVHVKEYPKAYFTVSGEITTWVNVTGIPPIGEYTVSELNLTSSPKTVVIDFSTDANRESVENSIRRDLDSSIQCDFTWLTDRQVKVQMSGFSSKEQRHELNLRDAIDVDGERFVGVLEFTTAAANQIGFIDLETYEQHIVAEIRDRRYMALPVPAVGDYIPLDTGLQVFNYNVAENRIVDQITYPDPIYYYYMDWLDSQTVLCLDWEKRMLKKYSFVDNQYADFFSFSTIYNDPIISPMKVSPDGSKIAIPFSRRSEEQMDLLLLSSSGEVLRYFPDCFFHSWDPGDGPHLVISWIDNRYFLIDDQLTAAGGQRIARFDTETGELEPILESANCPVYYPEKDILKYGDVDHRLKIGDKIIRIPFEGWYYYSFSILDENRLVCNEYKSKDIIVYKIAENTYTTIGTGRLIGLSADRKKLYFMTNYANLFEDSM